MVVVLPSTWVKSRVNQTPRIYKVLDTEHLLKILLSIFWNRTEHRLRMLWRVITQFLLMSLMLPVLQAGAAVLSAVFLSTTLYRSILPGFSGTSPLQDLVTILASGFAITASIYLSARFLDRRSFLDLGLNFSPTWWADFGFGFGLGAGLMLLIFLTELSLGWINVQSYFYSPQEQLSFPGGFFITLIFFVAIGFYEELLNRGYLIKNISEGLTGKLLSARAAILLACLLTSVFFGLLHSANPNITPLAVLNICLAGIFLAAGYLVTGQLALSIGLHISWNFFQGAVFGFPVSGTTALAGSLIHIRQLGPVLFTGGNFGPEGGLLGALASFLGLTIILLWKRSGIYLGLSQYIPAIPIVDSPPSRSSNRIKRDPQFKHIIWDWNGTLLDDLGLCLKIINNMLAARNLPSISRDVYLDIFDFPVSVYYQKIGFDFSKEPFESISNEFIKAYETGRPACNLMDGAREILSYAASLGISQSILSASKGSYLSKAIVEYDIQGYFNSVQGLDNHHAAGKLDLAKNYMETCHLPPSDMLLVGDTTHDGSISTALGVNCILIPKGHHNRQRLEETGFPVVSSLLHLKELL